MGGMDLLALLALAGALALLSRLPRAFSAAGCLLGFILALYGALLGWTLAWLRIAPPIVSQPIAGTLVPVGLPAIGALLGALAVRWLLRRHR